MKKLYIPIGFCNAFTYKTRNLQIKAVYEKQTTILFIQITIPENIPVYENLVAPLLSDSTTKNEVRSGYLRIYKS